MPSVAVTADDPHGSDRHASPIAMTTSASPTGSSKSFHAPRGVQDLAALVAGAVAALGFAPLFWWPLTIAALVLFLWQLGQPSSAWTTARRGWLFGFGLFAVGLNWVAKSFSYQSAMPHWLGWGAVAGLAAILACYCMGAALLTIMLARIGRVQSKTRAQALPLVLGFASAWGAMEMLRAVLFSGFAWNPLAEAALPTGLAAATRLVGTYGASTLVALAAGGIYAMLRRDWRTMLVGLGLPLAFASLAYLTRPAFVAAPRPAVTLVQPDVDQGEKWDPLAAAQNFAKLAALSPPRSDTARLLLWTESAFPDYLEDGYPVAYYIIPPQLARDRIAALMGPNDITLTGAVKLDFDTAGNPVSAHNSIFAIDRAGNLLHRYDKAHLLPWGEYVPYRQILEPLGITRFTPGSVDFKPGPGPATLDLGRFGKVGLLICYELIFSGHVTDRAHRPDFLFSPSNDAWFGRWGPAQHHAQARLRAIEEGLPVVRVTPTGVTAIIDADGATVRRIDTGGGRIDARIPLPRAATPFAHFGNWLALILVMMLALGALVSARIFD